MASSALPARRRVHIQVVDQAGKPLRGADIDFLIGGESAGSVRSSAGTATLEVAGSDLVISVVASLAEFSTKVDLHPEIDSYALQLPTPAGRWMREEGFQVPVARCADGTTGQPCVDCRCAGRTIRICV